MHECCILQLTVMDNIKLKQRNCFNYAAPFMSNTFYFSAITNLSTTIGEGVVEWLVHWVTKSTRVQFQAVAELFVNIYHIRVYPMFCMCVLLLFLFVLNYGIEVAAHYARAGTCLTCCYCYVWF